MTHADSDLTLLRDLFASQQLAVLSTDGRGLPYASLVAFAAEANLRRIFFATFRNTRKFANLSNNPEAALLVDNRSNSIDDFARAVAVTALGSCREIKGTERAEAGRFYLEKHSHLDGFVSSPDCALIRIDVRSLYLVTHFKEVTPYHFTS